MRKKAEAGIGTLILFIAMILVAAIAAGVLIQTSTALQSKAVATGSQARGQLSTNAQILSIYGDDASSNNMLENFYMEIKLTPGSDYIKLEDAVLEFSVSGDSASLTYNDAIDCEDTGTFNTTEFGVRYLLNGTNHIAGYLVPGDVAQICFEGVAAVAEEEVISFTIIPRTGSISSVRITTPAIMTSNTVYLFP